MVRLFCSYFGNCPSVSVVFFVGWVQILACIEKEKLQPDWKTYEPVLKCLGQLELWETYVEFYAEVLARGYSLT